MTTTGGAPVASAKLRHRLSASIQVADVDGDGAQELLVAGRSMMAFSHALKRRSFNFPKGGRPFASTPAARPGPSGAAVFVGCDDGSLYSNTPEARERGGALIKTGLDIYSSPVVFEHEGQQLITFGSDDEKVYCITPDGSHADGFPVQCGAFVSATPAVGDFDNDGAPEIVVGDWCGALHALRMDGTELPGFPMKLGQAIWSSAALADINGDGDLEAVVANRYLHAVGASAGEVAGFPRLLGSYTVGSPIVVDALGNGSAAIVVGSDKFYAFDGAGRMLPHFPVDLGAYLWASPLAARLAAGPQMQFVAAAWDGKVWGIACDGTREPLISTGGPIFSTPALFDAGAGQTLLAAGSWDQRIYVRPLSQAKLTDGSWPRFTLTADNRRVVAQPFERPVGAPAGSANAPNARDAHLSASHREPDPARHRVPTFIRFAGSQLDALEQATVFYKIAGEDREHSTPVYHAGSEVMALFQPLGLGRRVSYYFAGVTFDGRQLRLPAEGYDQFVVERLGPLPVGRFIAALEGKE